MQRQLDAFNLQYQFVDAIDKYDMYSQTDREAIAQQLDIDKQQLDYFFKSQKPGMVACSLSHIKIYNLMVKKNISQACILEDDAQLPTNFPKILAESQVFLRDMIMFSHESRIVYDILAPIVWAFRSKKFRMYMYVSNILKLIMYKKYFPELPLYMVYRIFFTMIAYTFFRCCKLKLGQNLSYIEARRLKIGGVPSPSKAPRGFISNRRLIEPLPNRYNTSSTGGYMLTCAAAIKWKHAIMYQCKSLDYIHGELYCRGDLDLLLVSPPCVITLPSYKLYSTNFK